MFGLALQLLAELDVEHPSHLLLDLGWVRRAADDVIGVLREEGVECGLRFVTHPQLSFHRRSDES